MSKKLGQLVKEARAAQGLSQAALAQKVDGLTASEIGKIERGEKEPSQAVLRQLAKALGVTQKSLLDAATGSSSAAGKTSSAKTSSAKTSSAKKPSAAKKTSSSSSTPVLTLTAAEKKLVQQYRKADSATKKAAMNLLSGNGNILELLPVLMSGGGSSSPGGGATELLGTLLSGKPGSSGNNELLNVLMNSLGKK